MRMRVDRRDERCVITTVDPETAERNPAVLRAIAQQRDSCAGVYGTPVDPGRVAVGDPVVLERRLSRRGGSGRTGRSSSRATYPCKLPLGDFRQQSCTAGDGLAHPETLLPKHCECTSAGVCTRPCSDVPWQRIRRYRAGGEPCPSRDLRRHGPKYRQPEREPLHPDQFSRVQWLGPRRRDPWYCEWSAVVGDRIRRLRRSRDLTQQQLGERVERPDAGGTYSKSYISRLERGWATAPLYVYLAIARALDVAPGRLLGADDVAHDASPSEMTLIRWMRRAGVTPEEAIHAIISADAPAPPAPANGIPPPAPADQDPGPHRAPLREDLKGLVTRRELDG